MNKTHAALDQISTKLDNIHKLAHELYISENDKLNKTEIEDIFLDECCSKLKNAYTETYQFANMTQNLIESIRTQINIAISLRGEGRMMILYLTQLNRDINKLEANRLLIPGVLNSMTHGKFYRFGGIDTDINLCLAKLNAELNKFQKIRPIKEELDTMAPPINVINNLDPEQANRLAQLGHSKNTPDPSLIENVLNQLYDIPSTSKNKPQTATKRKQQEPINPRRNSKIQKNTKQKEPTNARRNSKIPTNTRQTQLETNLQEEMEEMADENTEYYDTNMNYYEEIVAASTTVKQEALDDVRSEVYAAVEQALGVRFKATEQQIVDSVNSKVGELIQFYVSAISQSQSDIANTVLKFTSKIETLRPSVIDVGELSSTIDTLGTNINKINKTNQAVKQAIDALNEKIESGADNYGAMEAELRKVYNQQTTYIKETTMSAKNIIDEMVKSNDLSVITDLKDELKTLENTLEITQQRLVRMPHYIEITRAFSVMLKYILLLDEIPGAAKIAEGLIANWRDNGINSNVNLQTTQDLEDFVFSGLEANGIKISELLNSKGITPSVESTQMDM